MHIYCDFDETIVKTNKRVIDILNRIFNINKTVDDIHDWGYYSIHRGVTKQLIKQIYSSDEIFENLELYDGAKDVLRKYQLTICSVGDIENIKRKRKFLNNTFDFKFEFKPVIGFDGDKGCIDMSDGIQIDDSFKQLACTNAKYKILFKGFHNYHWQKVEPNSEIYIANTWFEIGEIIEYLILLDGEEICTSQWLEKVKLSWSQAQKDVM